MPVPRRSHILAGVLGLALVALALDRKWRQAPAEAEATALTSETSRPGIRETAASPPAAPPRESPAELPPPDAVCAWLERLPEVERVRDLFRPDHAFPVPASAKDGEQDQAADPVEPFENSHRLEGTFRGPDAAYAIVDGQVIRLGQSIDGFRLVRLGSVEAVFRSGSRSAVLRIAGMGPQNGGFPP